MSGKFRFVALWSCGCVFSERALKEIDTKICHKVSLLYTGCPQKKIEPILFVSNSIEIFVLKTKMYHRYILTYQKYRKNEKYQRHICAIPHVIICHLFFQIT
jgi:hypothetical protein